MSDLINKDESGMLRLVRVAKSDEFVRATLNGKKVIVFKNGKNNKNALFVHANKAGKKVYRTAKEKMDFEQEKVTVERHQSIKKNPSGTTIGDALDEKTRAKLMALRGK